MLRNNRHYSCAAFPGSGERNVFRILIPPWISPLGQGEDERKGNLIEKARQRRFKVITRKYGFS